MVEKDSQTLKYMVRFYFSSYGFKAGFGGHFETECLEGAIPKGQNSPQKCPYGLYAE